MPFSIRSINMASFMDPIKSANMEVFQDIRSVHRKNVRHHNQFHRKTIQQVCLLPGVPVRDFSLRRNKWAFWKPFWESAGVLEPCAVFVIYAETMWDPALKHKRKWPLIPLYPSQNKSSKFSHERVIFWVATNQNVLYWGIIKHQTTGWKCIQII